MKLAWQKARAKDGQVSLVSGRLLLTTLVVAAIGQRWASACHRVYFGDQKLDNIACKCNATHCDDQQLDFEWPGDDDGAFVQYLSSKSGARFERSILRSTGQQDVGAVKAAGPRRPLDYILEVQVNARQQQVMGFGGAFTDSASQLVVGLEEPVRRRLLEDYFGAGGLRYNMGRVPIGGTDMSARAYSYDDLPSGQREDLQLSHFRLQPEDLLYKVPLIRAANGLRRKLGQPELRLMAASWSAPSWMKSNKHLVQGRLMGNSSGPYYDAYARYQIRFLHEYERLNVTIWALSPQNEPHSPKRVGPVKINFNSVNFEPEEMADYLANSLVPNLIRANKTADNLKLFIWDDTLDGLASYQQAALDSSPEVRNFTLGLALHWYTTGLNEKPYRLLYEARRKLPPKYCMMTTEASFIGRPRPGEWWRGERYARDLIENLRVGSVAWIDWNLALNMSGGPTWSNNILDAAVLVDPSQQCYYKNPMYYALGHLSRFIEPRSHIVHSSIVEASSSNSGGGESQVQTGSGPGQPGGSGLAADELVMVAAELEEPLRVDGGRALKRRLAVVVLNRARQVRRVQLRLAGCHLKKNHPALELELAPSSLTSLAFVC